MIEQDSDTNCSKRSRSGNSEFVRDDLRSFRKSLSAVLELASAAASDESLRPVSRFHFSRMERTVIERRLYLVRAELVLSAATPLTAIANVRSLGSSRERSKRVGQ